MGGQGSKPKSKKGLKETKRAVSVIDPERLAAFQRRQRIGKEVIDTERSYSAALDACVQNMMVPLLEGGKGIPKIPKPEVKLIFANIEALNVMHKEFLSKLEALMTQESPLFGPLFEEYAPKFKEKYSLYINNYNESLNALVKCRNRHEDFDDFLINAKNASANGLDISALLIMPVQRLPRYILLLQDLLKNTFKDEPDYFKTETAVEIMAEVTQFVNNEKKIIENQYELAEIQRLLPPTAEMIMNRERFIITKGQLICKNVSDPKSKKKKDIVYEYFLMNDLLLICVTDNKRMSKFTAKLSGEQLHQLNEIERSHLSDVDHTATIVEKNTLSIKTPLQEYTFTFSSNDEMTQWLTKFREAKKNCPPKKIKKVISYELKMETPKPGESKTEKTPLVAGKNGPPTAAADEGSCGCSIM